MEALALRWVGVVVDVRLMLVFSARILVSTMGVVKPGVVMIVSVDRAQVFEFPSGTGFGVMGHMYVLMIVEQPFVSVALKALNHRSTPPSTRLNRFSVHQCINNCRDESDAQNCGVHHDAPQVRAKSLDSTRSVVESVAADSQSLHRVIDPENALLRNVRQHVFVS